VRLRLTRLRLTLRRLLVLLRSRLTRLPRLTGFARLSRLSSFPRFARLTRLARFTGFLRLTRLERRALRLELSLSAARIPLAACISLAT